MNVYVDKVGVNSELIFKISNKLTLEQLQELDNLVRLMFPDIKYSHINHLPNETSEYVYGLRSDTLLKGGFLITISKLKVVIDFCIIVK